MALETKPEALVRLDDLSPDLSAVLAEIPEIRAEIAAIQTEMEGVKERLARTEGQLSVLGSSVSGQLVLPATLSDLDVATLSAQFGKFADSLRVIGPSAGSGPALFVAGKTSLADTTIAGKLTVGLLTFADLEADISALNGTLSLQNGVMTIFQGVALGQGDALIKLNGNLEVSGEASISGTLRARTVEATGVTLTDSATGEPWCVRMSGGEIVKEKGKCP
jgi:hypothetical protein